jgi:hypothetical protein
MNTAASKEQWSDMRSELRVLIMQLGDDPSRDDVKAFTEKTLSSGKVVPGFGHAILRKTVSELLVVEHKAVTRWLRMSSGAACWQL